MITTNLSKEVTKVFGLYKAEWLNGQLFDLYTEPDYFNQIKTRRPCVLIGGRGTGKTTVLRGMSYQGQYALSNNDSDEIKDWEYIGLYNRVNTNVVSAFEGPELTEKDWGKCFAHYLNLILCGQILEFIEWYEINTGNKIIVSSVDIEKIALSLCLEAANDLKELSKSIDNELIRFEGQINNIGDKKPDNLSMQATPIDTLTKVLAGLNEFNNKQFYFLIDEYENYLDYQQRIVNTILKHITENYTIKIGVRELGWRDRNTISSHEILRHPADYEKIDLSSELATSNFKKFAEKVCNSRLGKVTNAANIAQINIQSLFPKLTENEEFLLLGGDQQIKKIRAEIKKDSTEKEIEYFDSLEPLEQYLIKFWADSTNEPTIEVLRNDIKSPEKANQRYVNYSYPSLFTVKIKKVGIRKYYSGWDVFVSLANGNIRFLMELVHNSLKLHFEDDNNSLKAIQHKNQTQAAIKVGEKNLSEIEGLSVEGAQLTKLLLGLGRIFGVMAENPVGHTPEVNQFHFTQIADDPKSDEQLENLIKQAVMHLVLVRVAGTKLSSENDTRSYDYMIHPIFSAFFVFSNRRKRKMTISGDKLFKLVKSPREGIKEILLQNNRASIDSQLPDQLSLFETFYSDVN